jgi:hypothetical protein
MKFLLVLILIATGFIYLNAVTVKDIRDNYSSYEGKSVTITGSITCPGGIFLKTNFYIQDSTGGVQCYKSGGDFSSQQLGDTGTATGVVGMYKGELELSDVEYTKAGSGTPPAPKSFTTGNANTTAAEGWLLKIAGTVTEVQEAKFYFKVDDGSGPVEVYIEKGITIKWTIITVGAKVTVKGIGSTYNTIHEVRPRYSDDVTQGTGIKSTTWGEIKKLYND